MPRLVKLSVIHGDVFEFDADVLVLKFARRLYGVDKAAVARLAGIGVQVKLPDSGGFALQKTLGSMKPINVLFVGVKSLGEFAYSEIRDFAGSALVFIARNMPNIQSIALTIYGPGYGLDEVEAFESELAGVIQAVADGSLSPNLQSITFVERDAN